MSVDCPTFYYKLCNALNKLCSTSAQLSADLNVLTVNHNSFSEFSGSTFIMI